AVAARARLNGKVVAVTGSVGKTSTKEMLRHVFAAQGPTHASVASFNNHWGVPLSLARCPQDAAYAVFEIGMNHAGEIAPLVAMVRPHVAIVTTVEPVHLEFFGTVEAIADAKAEMQARAAAEARARAQAEAEERAAIAKRGEYRPPEIDDEPEVATTAARGPAPGTVAKAATVGGMDLARTQVIGVIGAGRASRGLIRLRNGKIVTVRLGDKIDGGAINAIGNGRISYVRGGRQYNLAILNGR
ncbi:MAG TPA: Mur ligase family protein, partial [Burkholderiaceae bacterium]|nr:Mur ligase family protein [Burkholderiaceae bacterium]